MNSTEWEQGLNLSLDKDLRLRIKLINMKVNLEKSTILQEKLLNTKTRLLLSTKKDKDLRLLFGPKLLNLMKEIVWPEISNLKLSLARERWTIWKEDLDNSILFLKKLCNMKSKSTEWIHNSKVSKEKESNLKMSERKMKL